VPARQSATRPSSAASAPAFAAPGLLERILALTTDWYWEQGPDLRFSFLAATIESGLQHVVSTALGKTRREMARPGAPDKFWESHEEVLRLRKPFRDFEFEADDGHGRWRWISVSGEPVFSGTGNFLGYRGVAREITSKKLSEEQAREAEVVLGQAGAAIYTHDLDARILSWNAGAEKLLGYSAGEALGRNALELLLPQQGRGEIPAILKRIHSAGERAVDRVYVSKGGREIPVEVWSYPIHDENGKRRGEVVIARDISDRRRTQQALAEAEERYRGLLEMAPDAMLIHEDGQVRYANPAAVRLFEASSADQLAGKHLLELMHPEERPSVRSRIEQLTRGVQVSLYAERRILCFNGDTREVETASVAFVQGGRRMVQLIIRDITEHKQAARALVEAEARYRALFEVASDAIVVFDMGQNRIVDANANAVQLFGLDREQILKADPIALSPEHQPDGTISADRARAYLRQALEGQMPVFEWVHRHASGRPVYCEIRLVRVPPYEQQVIRGSILDITEKVVARQALREQADKLQFLAAHDVLTGLANRTLLNDRIQQAIERARRRKELFAVLFVDLDRFKAINDTLGHSVGDQALQAVAKLLQSSVRGTDTVARHGGDEFVVLAEEVNDEPRIELVARRIMQALSQPLTLEGNEVFLHASVGVSVYPKDGDSAEALIRHADIAMYQVKEAGRNDFRFFDPGMSVHSVQFMRIEHELRRAIERGELMLHYQPKVRTDSGKIVGFEALMRWDKPGLGLISPATFIPIAEETGMIVEMGYWAITQACRQIRAWQQGGLEEVSVAVNLSSRQFLDRNLTRRIHDILIEEAVDPRWLELEVTESATMQDEARSREIMKQLVEVGVHISLDDFGTGYSSLAYIMKFPIGTLKIDRSFISGVPHEQEAVAITQAVVAMGRSLELQVVAEGVETAEQVGFLLGIGCDIGQGFFFSPAVPPDQARALLRGGSLRRDYYVALSRPGG